MYETKYWDKVRIKYVLIDSFIDFNGILTCLGLFHA